MDSKRNVKSTIESNSPTTRRLVTTEGRILCLETVATALALISDFCARVICVLVVWQDPGMLSAWKICDLAVLCTLKAVPGGGDMVLRASRSSLNR